MVSSADNSAKEKLFLFDAKDHVAFLTNKVDADYHSHNYIQITIGLEKEFQIHIEEDNFYIKGIILDSNTRHMLQGHNEWQLYLLVNPESVFGEAIKRDILKENKLYILEDKKISKINKLNINSISQIISPEEYCSFIKSLKEAFYISDFTMKHKMDERMEMVLSYIEYNPLDKLSVKELGSVVFLSESRLSHLFKEEIGISLTSYILHVKLKKAFYLILKGLSITEAAIEAGFSSSSHFANSSRDKLGMTPKAIIKNSRYLQV